MQPAISWMPPEEVHLNAVGHIPTGDPGLSAVPATWAESLIAIPLLFGPPSVPRSIIDGWCHAEAGTARTPKLAAAANGAANARSLVATPPNRFRPRSMAASPSTAGTTRTARRGP